MAYAAMIDRMHIECHVFLNQNVLYCMDSTMEPIATVKNQLVHCIKWASWSIPQLPVAQVNNKTVQIVCIESNAHCIKESNYIDLLNQECRLKLGTN